MNGPYYIEVLSRNGEIRSRHRVDALPIRLGRGYDNDVIIDDPHTAAQHATIEQADDGSLQVRDLGSGNGIVHDVKRHAALRLDGDTVFRLGHTSVRVRGADFPVAAERADNTNHGWEGWPPALVGVALIALAVLTETWLTDFNKSAAIPFLLAVARAIGVGLIWAGTWALANRLFDGRARLGRHLFIAGSGMVALQLWGYLHAAVAFTFSLDSLASFASHISLMMAVGIVMFHAVTIKPCHPRRLVVLGVLVSLFGSGYMLMSNYQRFGQFDDNLYMSQLLPPILRISPNHSVKQFFDDAARLKAQADEDSAKPPGSGDTDD
jgi:hypothetical protein